jgi:hypothetical protein
VIEPQIADYWAVFEVKPSVAVEEFIRLVEAA